MCRKLYSTRPVPKTNLTLVWFVLTLEWNLNPVKPRSCLRTASNWWPSRLLATQCVKPLSHAMWPCTACSLCAVLPDLSGVWKGFKGLSFRSTTLGELPCVARLREYSPSWPPLPLLATFSHTLLQRKCLKEAPPRPPPPPPPPGFLQRCSRSHNRTWLCNA